MSSRRLVGASPQVVPDSPVVDGLLLLTPTGEDTVQILSVVEQDLDPRESHGQVSVWGGNPSLTTQPDTFFLHLLHNIVCLSCPTSTLAALTDVYMPSIAAVSACSLKSEYSPTDLRLYNSETFLVQKRNTTGARQISRINIQDSTRAVSFSRVHIGWDRRHIRIRKTLCHTVRQERLSRV